MANELQGRKVAILLAPKGTEQAEFVQPKQVVEEAGASVDVVGVETGEVQTLVDDIDHGEQLMVEKTFSQVSPKDYDALIVPGGAVGADTLRGTPEAVNFVRAFFEEEKPVGIMCHAPWILVEAGVLEGRRLTSFWTLQTDVRNVCGNWVDEEVVTDKGLVTSRYPGDLEAFCSKIVEEFAEGKHAEQARSV